MSVLVGTSGWVYDHWVGRFYPEDLPEKKWFDYYSRRFDTVEINNSFYRLPSRATFAGWRKAAPEGFLFTVKASRYITHVKKLKDPEEGVLNFYQNLSGMGDRCAAVLFQLPPKWHLNLDRLARFFEVAPGDYRIVFEFRDSSWLAEEVYDLLRARGAALCAADSPFYPGPRVVTSDFVFFRMHGGRGPERPSYGAKELRGLASEIDEHLRDGRDAFAYFNNDHNGYAVDNAMALRKALEDKGW
jgi:uncharacterized protein YecE (DUF72 family)